MSTVFSFSLRSFTLHALALSLVQTRPNLLLIGLTQPKALEDLIHLVDMTGSSEACNLNDK